MTEAPRHRRSVLDRLELAVARPATAAAVLILLYLGSSFLNDVGGYLGTDTGAKVATLERMVEQDSYRPAVGYWAEEWDPDGLFHPLHGTTRNDEDEWVNVTTLPMLLAARPLYELGGYRLALVLPALGAVGVALACRRLAGRLGSERDAVAAFWAAGLLGPMAIYAVDLWEHSLGTAFMLGATICMVEVLEGDLRWRWPVLAGVCLGSAATMRNESLVLAAVVIGVTCLVLVSRRLMLESVRNGALAVVGFAPLWFGNSALEGALGGNSRASRASGAASQRVASELTDRIGEAGITSLGLPGLSNPAQTVVGGTVVVLIIVAAGFGARARAQHARICLGFAGALVALALAQSGLGFVPGALMASPVAILALLGMPRLSGTGRLLFITALLSAFGIWSFQYLGGAGPQWGGRYILAPTMILTAIGAVRLREVPAPVGRFVVGMGLGVTIFGLAWISHRSHDVDGFFEDLARTPEDVVIVGNGFLVREAGPAYADRLYLSLGGGGTLTEAVDVVERSGFRSFAVLISSGTLPSLPATEIGVEKIDFLGVPFSYHRFRLP